MQLKIYSIYDVKSKSYARPFYGNTNSEAIRSFSDLVNDDNNTVSKHPEDFSLFEIGVFDDQAGSIKSVEAPTQLVTALELKKES